MPGLWLVLLGRVLGLGGGHFEVVLLGVVSGPLEAGFRCALEGGRLVLLGGQLRCS
jgi:hypothetical protein